MDLSVGIEGGRKMLKKHVKGKKIEQEKEKKGSEKTPI